MSSTLVSMRRVSKAFGENVVLRDINLEVARGEVVALMGPSGSGKSTLLRCVNQLETVDNGGIWIDEELQGYVIEKGRRYELRASQISKQRRQTAMVFQQFNLFQNLTVLENITAGLVEVRNVKLRSAQLTARTLLDRVGLADREHAYPDQLSGGQQQRVAIARALATEPKLTLFDEPTSALDPELVGEVLDLISELANEDLTMVIVTHEVDFARNVADRVVMMFDGVIAEQGPPEAVLDRPKNERTKRFLRKVDTRD